VIKLKDHEIKGSDLPKHTHPMPHTHAAGSHTHVMAHTHSAADHTHPTGDHTHTLVDHTHPLGAHTHGLDNHTHPLGGKYVEGSLGLVGNPKRSYLEAASAGQSEDTGAAAPDTTEGVTPPLPDTGTSELDSKPPGQALDKTGGVVKPVPATGAGSGDIKTVANLTTAAADGATGDADPEVTEDNSTKAMLPLKHEPDGTVDNRPAYLDVLYIIRVK
jgi:hypothetical protein